MEKERDRERQIRRLIMSMWHEKDFEKNLDNIIAYGWAIVIIIFIIGALFKMGAFDFKKNSQIMEDCIFECSKDGLELAEWDTKGDCIICYCTKEKPINCK